MWTTCVCLLAVAAVVHGQSPTLTNQQAIVNNGYTKMTMIAFVASGTKAGFPKIACKLDTQGYSTCQDPQVYTGLADGQHVLEVRFSTATGTVDSASTTFTWTVDTVAPSLVFTNLPYNPARPKTNSRTVGFAFDVQSSADRAGGITYTCALKDASSPSFTSQSCQQKSVTYINLGFASDDIAYNFTVTATDRAMNSKTLATNFAIDTKLPLMFLPAIGTSYATLPPRYTNKTSVSFSLSTDEPGQVFYTCRRDGVGSFLQCPTKPITGLAQGEHSLEVQVQDWAGNIQTVMNIRRPVDFNNLAGVNTSSAIFQWRVDTTPPPKPQIPSKPKLQTNTRLPAFAFTVAGVQIGGNTYSCRVAPPYSLGFDVPCFASTVLGSPMSTIQGIPAAGLVEGPYSFSVNAVDAAGNHGPSNTYNFTVDLSTPSAKLDSTSPSVPSGGTTNSPSMTFNFHAIDTFPEKTSNLNAFRTITRDPCPLYNCTMTCSLDGGAYTPCTSPITYSSLTAAGASQDHFFSVIAMDNATNIANASQEISYRWKIDRIPPSPRFLSTPATAVAVDFATFTWTTTEPLATPPSFRCRLDNGAYFNCTRSGVTVGVYTWTLANLTHFFNHRFDVEATDFYGNVAPLISYNWQVDLAPPLITNTGATQGVRLGNPIPLANGSYTNIRFVDFTFQTEPGARLSCSLDSIIYTTCSSPHRVSLTQDGMYMFRVRAQDPVGHYTVLSAQPYWSWILDTVGPMVTFSKQPPRYTNKLNATFMAMSTEQASTYQCEYRSSQFQTGTTSFLPCVNAPFNGIVQNNMLMVNLDQYAYSQSGIRIDFTGDHTFVVRAMDRASNIGPIRQWTFTVDITPPTIQVAAATALQPQEAYSTDFRWTPFNYATFLFQASEIVTYSCQVTPNVSWVNPFTPCSAPKVTVPGLDEMGSYTFTVRAVDRAGNFDPVKSVRTYTWTADPDVPQTRIVAGPKYYVNEWDSLDFQISTPVPRVRAECKVDRLYNNKTTWLNGTWTPCVDRSQTMMGPQAVAYTADAEMLLNMSYVNPDGFYAFKARIIDVFNRTSSEASYEFVIDTVPPQTALEGSVMYSTSSNRVEFGYFTDNPDYLHDYFECRLRLQSDTSAEFTRCRNVTYSCEWQVCGVSNNNVQAISGLTTPGLYQFWVRAVDKAGNPDGSPVITTFKYDPTPPVLTILSREPSTDLGVANDTWKFAFSSREGAQYTCYWSRTDDSSSPRVTNNCVSPVTYPPPANAVNTLSVFINFTVVATDPYSRVWSSKNFTATLKNGTTLQQRENIASMRKAPIVCTTNDTIYFIIFIVCVVFFILTVVIFPIIILRRMESQAMNRQRRSHRSESRAPLTGIQDL